MSIVYADSLARDDVNTAIGLASNLDTVIVPSGNVTWTSGITIPDAKKLIIQGAGIGNSIISWSVNGSAFTTGFSSSRITGFTFNIPSETGTTIAISTSGQNWRVDHCRFNNTSGTTVEGVRATNPSTSGYSPIGLVDHCEFVNARVMVYGSTDLYGHSIWYQALGLGTNNAVFVEDNTFTHTQFGNVVDSQYAGRYVFRYNTVTDAYLEAHSATSTTRAARSWEIYENTIIQSSQSIFMPFRLRGGTGVVFNNSLSGTYDKSNIGLDNVRSDNGDADGYNPRDGNAVPENGGYQCRDQIGASKDAFLNTGGAPYPSQLLEPAYEWNNLLGGSTNVDFEVLFTQSQVDIVEDRDFYNDTQKPSYSPYTYPHPLQAGSVDYSNILIAFLS